MPFVDPSTREPDEFARRLRSDREATYGSVFDHLHRILAAETEPVLELDDLHALLFMHRIVDANGTIPAYDNWIPTYDLNAAAAEGWRWKAARAAERFSFSADGASYNRDQIYQHCMEQAKRYSSRIMRSLDVSPFGNDSYGDGVTA